MVDNADRRGDGPHLLLIGEKGESSHRTVREQPLHARAQDVLDQPALVGWTSGEPLQVQTDISDPAAVERLIDQVDRRHHRIDIVVNNAALTGVHAVASFLECSPEQLDRIVDVNLKGTYYVSQYAARLMVRRKIAGSIIHIASVGAFAAQQYASAYCATKAAVVSLAQ